MSAEILLARRQRRRARQIARECYLQADCDRDEAIRLAHHQVADDVMQGIFVTILIGVVMQLVINLIVSWIQNHVTSPPVDWVVGEPGFTEFMQSCDE